MRELSGNYRRVFRFMSSIPFSRLLSRFHAVADAAVGVGSVGVEVVGSSKASGRFHCGE
jgi:hypothetical protein